MPDMPTYAHFTSPENYMLMTLSNRDIRTPSITDAKKYMKYYKLENIFSFCFFLFKL